MTPNRISAGVVTLVLVGLLAWSVIAGVGGVRTWVMLGVGATLGAIYTAFGRIPEWIVDHSDGDLTDDDDPSNISARVYLPILLGVIVLAVIGIVVVIRFM